VGGKLYQGDHTSALVIDQAGVHTQAFGAVKMSEMRPVRVWLLGKEVVSVDGIGTLLEPTCLMGLDSSGRSLVIPLN